LALSVIFVIAVAGVAGLYGLVRGGSLDGLAATRFRFLWLLFVGFVVQVAFGLWNPPWLSETGELAIVLASNLLVAVFLAANVHLPGTLVAAAGLALNALVIAANGAMPVSLEAADVAGVDREASDFGIKHEVLNDDTVLPWIADVIPIPGLSMLISAGDVVLAAGIGWLVYRRTLEDPDSKPSQGGSPEI
jgi:Family of unknown function (DUF5317)